MNAEFFEALALLEKEKGIPAEYIIEKIKNAILIATKKEYGNGDNIVVDIDPEKKNFSVYLTKNIVEEVENPELEITLEDAKKMKARSKLGGVLEIPIKTKDFGRIAAQTAKHVIHQNIREVERKILFDEISEKQGELLTVTVMKIDHKKGAAVVEIGKNEAMLPKSEMLPGEEIREGDRIKVYIVEVASTDHGPKIMISRTHSNIIRRMLETEVPEIFDGTVEIKGIAREAGARTKIAVYSKDPNVDPRGACIGPRGSRIATIVEELGGEKIDVVLWSENPDEFISEALSPANVKSVEVIDPETKACKVTVPDHQLSLAIGNKGQNARLAARLTGFKIDIRPESGYYGEEE